MLKLKEIYSEPTYTHHLDSINNIVLYLLYPTFLH